MGAASERIAANLRRIRAIRGLTTYQLSERLAAIGHTLRPTGITYIEAGTRRVDVDDLVALAAVLNCSPNRLIMPDGLAACAAGDVKLAGSITAHPLDAWAWAIGERPLLTRGGTRATGVDAAVFAIENQPHHHVMQS